jgi:hypothetical protein
LIVLLALMVVGVATLVVVPMRASVRSARVSVPTMPPIKLPSGMTMTVAPPQQLVPAGAPSRWQPRLSRMSEIDPPALPGGRVNVPLREAFDRYVVGGGGRYHLFHLPKAGVIAVVDVSAAAVVKEIPVGRDGVQFAAGRRYFLIYDPFRGELQRWTFKRFECDRVAPLPANRPLRELVMAPADDVAYLTYDTVTNTLDPLEMRVVRDAAPAGQWLRGLRLSFDGQLGTLGNRTIGLTFGRRALLGTIDGAGPGAAAVPGTGGHHVFVGDRIFTPYGRAVERPPGAPAGGVCLPSADERYFWIVSGDAATLYTTAGGIRVYTVKRLEPIAPMGQGSATTFCHLPQAKALVLVQPSNVVLQRFDLDEALRQSREPYLFIRSLPVESVRRGMLYTYWLDTVSSSGGLRYRLQTGPKGMSVNEHAGFVQWKPDEDEDPGPVRVSIAVQDDGGRQAVQNFELDVTE